MAVNAVEEINKLVQAIIGDLNKKTTDESGKAINEAKPESKKIDDPAKAKEQLSKQVKHLQTELKDVVELIKEIEKLPDGIDKKKVKNATKSIKVVLSMPAQINEAIKAASIETIDFKSTQLAVGEIQKLYKTINNIYKMLNVDPQNPPKKAIKSGVDQLEYILKLPGWINRKVESIKVEEVDVEKLQAVADKLDRVFGPGGVLSVVSDACKEINNAKMMNFGKFIAINFTFWGLKLLLHVITEFGRKAQRTLRIMNITIVGLKIINEVIQWLAITIQEIQKAKISIFTVLKIRWMKKFIKKLEDVVQALIPLSIFAMILQNTLKNILCIKLAIMYLADILDSLKPFGLVRIWLATGKIKNLGKFVSKINDKLIWPLLVLGVLAKTLLIAMGGLKIVKLALDTLSNIYEKVQEFGFIGLWIASRKINTLRKFTKRLGRFVRMVIRWTPLFALSAIAIPPLLMTWLLVTVFAGIVQSMKKIKMGLWFKIKMYFLIKSMKVFRKAIRQIIKASHIRGVRKAMVRMIMIRLLIFCLAQTVVSLMLLTPILMLFVMLSPFIIITLFLFRFVFRIMIKIITKMARAAVPAMLLLGVIIGAMLLIGVLLLVLALIVTPITDHFLDILLFFGLILGIALIIGVMGLVLSYLAPFLQFALLGIAYVAIAVIAVVVIAVLLWLLQKLELDEEAIEANVKKVLNTAQKIITWIFSPMDDPTKQDGADEPDQGILSMIGNGIGRVIGALLACVTLVFMAIAVGAILLIASMLRLIQNLDLNPEKIVENVTMVLSTCELIIDMLFHRKDDEESGKSSKGGLVGIISWISPELGMIVEAALAFVYLFLMLLAVGLVLAIACMLRLLQNLELNPEKIMENVTIVFDTCDKIINTIFSPRKEDDQKSSRGALITIISWIDEGLAKIVEAALAVVYLLLMMLAIGLVLAIAGLLKLIQEIDLDIDKITENVDAVFDTCQLIIDRIFTPAGDEENKSSRGILITIISWVDEGLAKIFEAALSIVYLFLMMMAVGLVLAIAKLLEEIQNIDLDFNKISENVTGCIDTCKKIISLIFDQSEKEEKPTKRGILSSIISFFSPELGMIIDALMTIAFLFLMMIAITIVVGIAKQLKEMQDICKEVNLKEIEQTAMNVIGTGMRIMGKIYEAVDDDWPQSKNRSFMTKLIAMFSPDLADMVDALMAIMKLSLIQTAVSCVSGIAEQIKKLGEISASELMAGAANVYMVMSIAKDIMAQIFKSSDFTLPEPTDDEMAMHNAGFWRRLFPADKDDVALEIAMRKLEVLQMVSSAVASLASICEGIQKIMTDDIAKIDMKQAHKKICEVMTVATSLANIIFNPSKYGLPGIVLPQPSDDEIDAALQEIGSNIFGYYSAEKKARARVEAQMKLVAKIMDTLMKTAASVGALAQMVQAIETITKSDLDFKDSKSMVDKVKDVMSVMTKVASYILSGEADSLGGIIMVASGKVVGNGFNFVSTKDMIDGVTDFSKILTELSKLGDSTKTLIDKWKEITNESITTTINKIVTATSEFNNVLLKIDDVTTDVVKVRSVISTIDSCKNIASSIKSVCDAVAKEDISNIKKKTDAIYNGVNDFKTIVDLCKTIPDGVNIERKMGMVDRINETMKGIVQVSPADVKRSKEITQNYIKFLDKINSMDKTKLHTTERLMAHWARISYDIRGNFEGLAKTMNQHIMPALNTLNETMEKVNACQKQVIEELKNPVELQNGTTPSNPGETPPPSNPKEFKDGNKTYKETSAGSGVYNEVDSNGTVVNPSTTYTEQDGRAVPATPNKPDRATRK